MRVALTGATGFCGGAIAASLHEHGHHVVTLGRRPLDAYDFVHWDAGAGSPPIVRADIIVHAAAHVGDQGSRDRFMTTNVNGTQEVLSLGLPTVVISSASVYGPHATPVKEDTSSAPRWSHYASSKAKADGIAIAAGAVVLRPRAVYGPGDPHLEPRILAAASRGRLVLPGASRALSLTHVANLASAASAALTWPTGVYNIADAVRYDRDEALLSLCSAHGLDVTVVHVPRLLSFGAAAFAEFRGAASISRYAVDQLANPITLDITKATSMGWHPARTLADHLEQIRRR